MCGGGLGWVGPKNQTGSTSALFCNGSLHQWMAQIWSQVGWMICYLVFLNSYSSVSRKDFFFPSCCTVDYLIGVGISLRLFQADNAKFRVILSPFSFSHLVLLGSRCVVYLSKCLIQQL